LAISGVAHGSPIGLLDSATTSMVFAVRSDYIQTDAPINSSKFCGPLPNPATRWGHHNLR